MHHRIHTSMFEVTVPSCTKRKITHFVGAHIVMEVDTLATKVNTANDAVGLGAKRFERFSSLSSLQRAIAALIVIVRKFKQRRNQPTKTKPEEYLLQHHSTEALEQAMTVSPYNARRKIQRRTTTITANGHNSRHETTQRSCDR
jgi:hypothetical protein